MLSRDRIVDSREIVLKKRNSEIESRLFAKTRYYVIAVGNRSSSNEHNYARVRAYIYYNGYICFYNTQGKAYNKQEYIKYIDFVKKAVNTGRYQWTDFWINKGQIITKDRRNKIHVDSELVFPFSSKTRVAGSINDMSLDLYYEFLKNNSSDSNKLESLKSSYTNGELKNKIERKTRSMSDRQLKDQDGEIIVRTKIEGYNYVDSYVKSILNSNVSDKFNKINNFFERVFFLEMYGYICDEEE